jgi:CelD/BcsL family acetyltransferase involved in cellulose biosynthesis
MILLGETFKDAIETGLVEYDFLRGAEPYKLEGTTRERRTVAVRVPGAGGRGQWLTRGEELARRARLIAARVLPAETVERVRRMRRRRASA